MTQPPRDISFEPFFGGFVIETLTIGMYEEHRNAIREYVQNGFDSIQRAIMKLKQLEAGEGLIRIVYDTDREGVRIRDNGAGLPAETAVATLTSIGASAKSFSSDAGFRGIGRLAGVAFCDTLTFVTKAADEPVETTVIFDARMMRKKMTPAEGSDNTAYQLLKECVKGSQRDVPAYEAPFFEVSMRSFLDPPIELTSPQHMAAFLAQVSPVDYRDDFPSAQKIREWARRAFMPTETVRITIEFDGDRSIEVRKPYGTVFGVANSAADVPLSDVKFYNHETGKWWAWIGKKDVPGSYTDEQVRGIRVRVKNIQIDGTELVRDIFRRQNKSNGRYQDWFVGEIFVDPKAVVPNARRDGFEDTRAWATIRKEIGQTVCKDAGSWAQEVSNQGQFTLEKLSQKTDRLREDFEGLRRKGFGDVDQTLAVSAAITKLQANVGSAARNAEAATLGSLQALNSRLLDMKAESLGKLTSATLDRDLIESEARDALLSELMILFEQHLELRCLSGVRNIVKREFGWPAS